MSDPGRGGIAGIDSGGSDWWGLAGAQGRQAPSPPVAPVHGREEIRLLGIARIPNAAVAAPQHDVFLLNVVDRDFFRQYVGEPAVKAILSWLTGYTSPKRRPTCR